eukprot:10135018-Ditylum_brightwellii.AAC.1
MVAIVASSVCVVLSGFSLKACATSSVTCCQLHWLDLGIVHVGARGIPAVGNFLAGSFSRLAWAGLMPPAPALRCFLPSGSSLTFNPSCEVCGWGEWPMSLAMGREHSSGIQ